MMISSAVVIPERNSSPTANGNRDVPSNSPSLKRKLSHSTLNERKRPKVDTVSDMLNYDDARKSASPEDLKKPASQNSPPRRRPAPAADEKKRNQRLFGSLLGTLSQSNVKANPAHKKRDEIEARQRDRLKREHEEQESARKRKKEDLAKKRRAEQRHWEEEGRRLKHANMKAMAGFLRTKTEPVLHYLPWELRPDEEATIQRQKDEADALIQQDLESQQRGANPRRNNRTNHDENSMDAPKDHDDEQDHDQVAEDPPEPQSLENGDAEQHHRPESETDQNGSVSKDTNDAKPESVGEEVVQKDEQSQDAEAKDDDQHGDELVEGQEDDVIY